MENQITDEKRGARLPLLVFLFCVLQPVLDVTSYAQQTFGLPNTGTMILRLLLLAAGFVLGYLVTERKRVYYIASLIIVLYLLGHVLACMKNGGYRNWSEDLTDQARTLLLPITALSLISCIRKDPDCFRAMNRGLLVNLLLILAVELLSTVTGTDPHTYEAKGLGVRGWFVWTSPQSAILSLLAPLTLGWVLTRFPDRSLPVFGICLLSFGALYLYGTRLAYFTLSGAGLGMSLVVLLCGKTRWRQALAILLCTLLFVGLYPWSPMVKNRSAMDVNAKIKQERISAAVEALGVPAGAGSTEDPAALAAAYHYNLQGMLDRFGEDRVVALYGNTLNADLICNDRIMKTNFCGLLMEEASETALLPLLFGLEIGKTRVDETAVYRFETDDWEMTAETYDPENDFYGVFFLCGIVGLALLSVFLLYFGVRAAAALIRRPKEVFSPLFAAYFGAFLIAMVYAWSTASVLRRNNASVYFAMVLAGLWYLTSRGGEKGSKT